MKGIADNSLALRKEYSKLPSDIENISLVRQLVSNSKYTTKQTKYYLVKNNTFVKSNNYGYLILAKIIATS
jgi:hypothetical protein